MKAKLLLLFIIIFPEFAKAQNNLPIDWMQQYQTCAIDIPTCMIRCSDNGFMIAGWNWEAYIPIPLFCPVPDRAGFVTKTDSLGNIQWRFNAPPASLWNETVIESVIEVNANTYVLTGHANGAKEIYLAKLDSSGSLVWEHFYGNSLGLGMASAKGTTVKQTYDGGFIVSSLIMGLGGDVTNFYGSTDYWIFKTDSSGVLEWEKSFGGTSDDQPQYVIQLPDSGFVIGGNSTSYDFDVSNPIGGGDIWLVRIDKTGNLVWDENFGGSDYDILSKLIICNDGDLLFSGYTSSNDYNVSNLNGFVDGWIVKIDVSGNIVWEKTIGDSSTYIININDITEADSGIFYFTGAAIDTVSPTNTMVIGSINNNGNTSWFDKLAVSSTHTGISIVADDNIYITGNNGNQMFLIKLLPEWSKLTGYTYLDLNANSILDTNEPFVKNQKLTEINTGRIAFSDSDGDYIVILPDTGNFTVQPSPLIYFNPVPVSRSVYFPALNTINTGNDFAFQPNGVYSDLKIVLTPMTVLRRGFNATFDLYYKNVGTTTISNPVVQLFMDSILTYQNSNILPSSVTTDSITWNLPSLGVFDDGHIQVNVMVDLNSVLGSVVNTTATIEPLVNDNAPGDNFSSAVGQIIGSFDPNDITVNFDTIYLSDPATHELEYLIRFQNTGNDTAFTVEVVTPVSPLLDFNQFELTSTSHPASIAFNAVDRNLRVRFDSILLPDSGTNQAGSNGYIRFKIKPVNTINAGDIIEVKADIYFDFNAAVETNIATSLVLLSTGIIESIHEEPLRIYPNPVIHSASVDIILTEKSRIDMFIYNSTGQLVSRNSQSETPTGKHRLEFSTAELEKGIYMLRIITGNNAYTAKFVK